MAFLEDLNMIATKTIAAGIIAVASLAAVPANASGLTVQFGFDGPGWGGNHGHHGHHGHRNDFHSRLSADQIRWMLRGDGYRRIRFFDDHGPVYQLRASRHGRDYFLVVSARDGQILSRERI